MRHNPWRASPGQAESRCKNPTDFASDGVRLRFSTDSPTDRSALALRRCMPRAHEPAVLVGFVTVKTTVMRAPLSAKIDALIDLMARLGGLKAGSR